MAKKSYRVDLDLNQNELLKAKLETLASAPGSPVLGQIYFDSTKGQIGVCINATGPVWSYGGGIADVIGTAPITVNVDINGIATVAINAATQIAPGSMSAADKLKLDSATDANTNSTIVMRDASGNFKASNPVVNSDVATKQYVDGVAQGLVIKAPVRAIAVANVASLSGPQTIDGVSLVAGNRVLLTSQTTTTQDGIYQVNAGAWTRTADFALGSGAGNAFTFVGEGTLYADTGWVCTNNAGSDIVGTDNLVFVQFSAAGIINAGLGLVKTGNDIDVVAADASIQVNANDIQVKRKTTGAIGLDAADGVEVNVDTNHININGSNQLTIGNYVAKIGSKAISVGGGTPVTITHNFGTRNVNTIVYDASTYETYEVNVVNATTNTTTISANGTNTNVIAVLVANVGETIV